MQDENKSKDPTDVEIVMLVTDSFIDYAMDAVTRIFKKYDYIPEERKDGGQ